MTKKSKKFITSVIKKKVNKNCKTFPVVKEMSR